MTKSATWWRERARSAWLDAHRAASSRSPRLRAANQSGVSGPGIGGSSSGGSVGRAAMLSSARRSAWVDAGELPNFGHHREQAYLRVEEAADSDRWVGDDTLLDLIDGEAANSVATLNVLQGEEAEQPGVDSDLADTRITHELAAIDPDLDARWRVRCSPSTWRTPTPPAISARARVNSSIASSFARRPTKWSRRNCRTTRQRRTDRSPGGGAHSTLPGAIRPVLPGGARLRRRRPRERHPTVRRIQRRHARVGRPFLSRAAPDHQAAGRGCPVVPPRGRALTARAAPRRSDERQWGCGAADLAEDCKEQGHADRCASMPSSSSAFSTARYGTIDEDGPL